MKDQNKESHFTRKYLSLENRLKSEIHSDFENELSSYDFIYEKN